MQFKGLPVATPNFPMRLELISRLLTEDLGLQAAVSKSFQPYWVIPLVEDNLRSFRFPYFISLTIYKICKLLIRHVKYIIQTADTLNKLLTHISNSQHIFSTADILYKLLILYTNCWHIIQTADILSKLLTHHANADTLFKTLTSHKNYWHIILYTNLRHSCIAHFTVRQDQCVKRRWDYSWGWYNLYPPFFWSLTNHRS